MPPGSVAISARALLRLSHRWWLCRHFGYSRLWLENNVGLRSRVLCHGRRSFRLWRWLSSGGFRLDHWRRLHGGPSYCWLRVDRNL